MLTTKRVPSDMVTECLERYSTDGKIQIEECLDLFDKRGEYFELIYAIHAMVNRSGYRGDVWMPLKLGTDYINKVFNVEKVGKWKTVPIDEYMTKIKALAGERLYTDDVIAEFVANCLCGAWVVKHGGKAA